QALALNGVGWAHARLGDHQQALTACQQALPLLQELGDRDGQAATWDTIGYAHHHLGHHAQALTSYQHALDLVRDLGDRYSPATPSSDPPPPLRPAHPSPSPRNHPAAPDAWQQAWSTPNDPTPPAAAHPRANPAPPDTPTPDPADSNAHSDDERPGGG